MCGRYDAPHHLGRALTGTFATLLHWIVQRDYVGRGTMMMSGLPRMPLVGGGFAVAFAQLCIFYYACGSLLHFIIPVLLPVKSVQSEPRKAGSVGRDALYSLGEPGLFVAGGSAPHSGCTLRLLQRMSNSGIIRLCCGVVVGGMPCHPVAPDAMHVWMHNCMQHGMVTHHSACCSGMPHARLTNGTQRALCPCCAVRPSGPLAVKAAIWTAVEWMFDNGWGQLYLSPVSTPAHVGCGVCAWRHR